MSARMLLLIGGLVLSQLPFPIPASASQAISVYQIGNSLTNDSQPEAISSMAEAAGVAWTFGYHLRNSSSLRDIWNNPTAPVTSAPGPTYVEGLRDWNWDVIAMQPYNKPGNTMADDLSSMKQFIDLSRSQGLNLDSRYFIYTSWPQSNLWHTWLNPAANSLTQLTVPRRQYYEHLAERISDEVDATVYVIPVGDVLYRVREEWLAGKFPELGYFPYTVYRDSLHLSYSTGRFIASTTVLSTVLGIDPTGIAPAPDFGSINPVLAQRLQKIVWEVVANNPYTGVVSPRMCDINGDGDVDHLDLAIWANDLASQPVLRADANGDLRVDQLDLAYWESAQVPSATEFAANLNGDLQVDDLDRQLWVSNFGSSGASGDANGDNVVNAADYALWRDGFAQQQARLKADFNGDGFVNELDVEVWEEQNGLFWELRADWSGNKVLDQADVEIWQQNFYDFSARLVGDYDQNGVVDLNDHAVWQQTLGSRYLLNADGNDDGEVNQADYDVWLSFYNQGSGEATAVPEPAAIALAGFTLSLIGLLLRSANRARRLR